MIIAVKKYIEHDLKILKKIQQLVNAIAPDKDAKLQTLKNWLSKTPLKDKKRIIFTQYADTAKYLYENLNLQGKHDDIEVIYIGNNKNKALYTKEHTFSAKLAIPIDPILKVISNCF